MSPSTFADLNGGKAETNERDGNPVLRAKLLENVLSYSDNSGSETAYRQALTAITALLFQVERPGDLAFRIRFQMFENVVLVMLSHLGVLQALVEKTEHDFVSATELSGICGVDKILIVRLLRLPVATGLVQEAGPESYRSTQHISQLATLGQRAGLRFVLEVPAKAGSDICYWLDTCKDAKPRTLPCETTPMQFAFHKTLWQLFDDDENLRQIFNDYMNSDRKDGHVQTWHERCPPCQYLAAEMELKRETGAALVVDVGGGFGSHVEGFRSQFPDLPDKCVLQDLPQTIEQAGNIAGAESMAYDFFTPQPVKGARIYLFRSIMHDWRDEDCRKILANTVAAMDSEYPRLLIDEWVVPECDSDLGMLKAACLDIAVMLGFDGLERTLSQWRDLLSSVGLEMIRVYYGVNGGESIIKTRVCGY